MTVTGASSADATALNPIAILRADADVDFSTIDGLVMHRLGSWAFATLAISGDDVRRLARVNAESPEWVAALMLRHHTAVARIAACTPCYPLPFGLVVPTLDELAAAAALQKDTLNDYFVAVDGADEWSFRLRFAAPEVEAAAGVQAVSGIDWLRRRALPRNSVPAAVDALVAIVRVHARACLERPADARQDAGGGHVVVALVAREHCAALFSAVADWAAGPGAGDGISLERTGPWAPYSFRPRLGDPSST